ncbi:MAG: Ger(x)C family spore germination C-terminal domain-containing protein [Christensenellaceae bacterium]
MHSRNSVRYYLILAALVTFLFFTNDFGLIDIQKTAIVMAVGIDREGPTFILTTQIAVPQSSDQGEQAQAVQIESRGETIADAFNQINAKTGWYPKLVFCNLVVLGEQMIKSNVFDALDFFLRDEYMSDKCLVAACEGTAKEILNTKTPIDPMSGVAAQKVLSDHAARVGTVASNTLREFAMGYFSYSKSGYLPVLKPEKQQESSGENGGGGGEQQQSSEGGGEKGAFLENTPLPAAEGEQNALKGDRPVPAAGGSGGSGPSAGGQAAGGKEEEKVFSASETALFYDGIYAGKLDQDETFAFSIVKNKLRLASYTPKSDGIPYTLIVKHNLPSLKFSVDDNSMARLKIKLKVTAGLQDTSYGQSIDELANAGKVPPKVFEAAKKDLEQKISQVFEKSRKSRCDVFNVLDRLQKFESDYFPAFREDILDRLIFSVDVTFESLR